jgi:signal transduction histidine kinase
MSIVGGLELLEDKLNDDTKENTEGEISMISRNVERLHKLAEDILQVSSIESGNFRINLQKTDLDSLISVIISEIKRKYSHEKNIPILVENYSSRHNQQQQQQQQNEQQNSHKNLGFYSSRESELPVLCDPGKIGHVLYNLLDNAFKFTENGQIVISVMGSNNMASPTVSENREEILISIKDTGKGIDPLIKDRLFQRFAAKSVKGTGLGLYISKKIIEAHGGKIWVMNNDDDDNIGGTTFTFSLPSTNSEENNQA